MPPIFSKLIITNDQCKKNHKHSQNCQDNHVKNCHDHNNCDEHITNCHDDHIENCHNYNENNDIVAIVITL